jgi:hypothetical protein
MCFPSALNVCTFLWGTSKSFVASMHNCTRNASSLKRESYRPLYESHGSPYASCRPLRATFSMFHIKSQMGHVLCFSAVVDRYFLRTIDFFICVQKLFFSPG